MTPAYLGPERCLSDRLIRKMCVLANISRNTVFYDFGCGLGHVCVIAVTEFGAKRAVGIELHRGRAKKARKYVRKLGLSRRIKIRHETFHDSDCSDTTVIYNGTSESEGDLTEYEAKLKNGCRFVTPFLPLVGIIPDAQDYPFYLMRKPFTKTGNLSRWLFTVLSKKATVSEFFKELDIDLDWQVDKRTLKSLMRKRFDMRPSKANFRF